MCKKKQSDNDIIEKIKTLPEEIIFEIYSFCVPSTEISVTHFIAKPPCLMPCVIGNMLAITSYSVGYWITGIAWGVGGEFLLINCLAGGCVTSVTATACFICCKEELIYTQPVIE